MLTTEPLPDSRRWGSAALRQRERGAHVEVERALERPHVGVDERHRHRTADVVHHDVEATELGHRGVDETGDGVEVGQVGGDHHGAPAPLLHLRGDVVELVGGAGGDDDVGTGLGQSEGRRGADAAPGGGDDGDAVVETEAVEQHAGTLPGRYVARMTVPTVDDQPTPAQLDALYDSLRNWGRWGADDELGTLNFLTARAARRRGRAGAQRRHREPGPRLPGEPVAGDAEPRAPPHARQRRRARLHRHPGLRGQP